MTQTRFQRIWLDSAKNRDPLGNPEHPHAITYDPTGGPKLRHETARMARQLMVQIMVIPLVSGASLSLAPYR